MRGHRPGQVSRLCRSETHGDVVLWEADFGYTDDQVRLCTPWFDMTSGRFEASSD
ncbi:hypothetical protein [Luteimonas deserti]|uniref:hypothetical protein n=1 Tax=Luteimonas deserti TaxID=2752306 RepID=UPI0015D6A5E8|nr:hypothetical protein [Luteimonas deserti]